MRKNLFSFTSLFLFKPLHRGGCLPVLTHPLSSQSPCCIPHVALFLQWKHLSEQFSP